MKRRLSLPLETIGLDHHPLAPHHRTARECQAEFLTKCSGGNVDEGLD